MVLTLDTFVRFPFKTQPIYDDLKDLLTYSHTGQVHVSCKMYWHTNRTRRPYWEVMAVGTERKKTTEKLVSCSLYGIVSLSDRTPSPLGECSSSIKHGKSHNISVWMAQGSIFVVVSVAEWPLGCCTWEIGMSWVKVPLWPPAGVVESVPLFNSSAALVNSQLPPTTWDS